MENRQRASDRPARPLRSVLCALLVATAAAVGADALAASVSGAHHFVSPTGSATWEQSLDAGRPSSLATANVHARPGDTVHLLGGTYHTPIAPRQSGTPDPGGRIVFAAHDSDVAVLRDAERAIDLDGRSYITVRGIDARDCRQFLVIRAGHHNDIGHCRFEQNSTRSVWMGSWVYDSSTYNRIHDCVFTRFGWVDDGDDKGALLDIGYDTSTTDASDGNVLENNVLAYGGHHVLHICGAHNVVRGNYLHNEAWLPCERQGDCGNRNAMTIGPMARQNLFEDNRFAFAGVPPDDNGANGLVLRSPDNIVRRNVSYANAAAGIALASMAVSVPTGNRIYANTIHRNGYGAVIDSFWTGGVSFGNWGNGPMPGNILVNNILHGNRDGRAIVGYGEAGPQSLRTNWLEAGDPGFVDASLPPDPKAAGPTASDLPDYRLRPDSPCIDAGEFLTRIIGATGSGTELAVEDAGFFYDGWGIPGELGDRIQLEGARQAARIIAIDYEAGRITVDRPLSWVTGQGVSLAYAGAGPDLGAHEYRAALPWLPADR